MFVTVLFGDSKMEMFNLNCKLLHFIRNLKERSGMDVRECVDLMDSRGLVMNLEAKQHSLELASSLLAERQHYVLLQVCRTDAGGRKYVSLLNNLSHSHPELTELQRKLLSPGKKQNGKTTRRREAWRRGDKNICTKK